MREYFVYMLKCADDSYYIGVTNDYSKRFEQHQLGFSNKSYTYSRRPVELVYLESFNDIKQAIAWEKQIKGWTRAKKKALIEQNYSKIKELAECKNSSSHKNYEK